MKLFVKVKTKSRVNKVEVSVSEENHFKVAVKEAPERGKANRAVIELLADYFKLPKKNFEIIQGLTVRNKVIELKR